MCGGGGDEMVFEYVYIILEDKIVSLNLPRYVGVERCQPRGYNYTTLNSITVVFMWETLEVVPFIALVGNSLQNVQSFPRWVPK